MSSAPIVTRVTSQPGQGVPAPDRLALMSKVARLYHEQGIRQPEIADRLGLSLSRVSRLLR